jgi:putative endonuclease
LSFFRGNVSLRSSLPRSVGAAAEEVVCGYLIAQGCEILDRNVHVGHLELDIVARLGVVALVVEVRHRGIGAWTSGLGSIGGSKRYRVRTAGERLWDRKLKYDPRLERMRFDSASVTYDDVGKPSIEYIAAAF